MLRNISIILVFLSLIITSCSVKHSQYQSDNELAVKAVFSDYFRNRFHWRYNDFPGFLINRQLCYTDSLTPYVFLHAEYEHYLSEGQKGNKTITGNDNPLKIDFDKLIPRLRDTIYLPKDLLVKGMPIVTTIGIKYRDYRSYNFSPLISTNKKNTYVLLLEVLKKGYQIFYFFSATKKDGQFKIEVLDYNDFIFPLPPRLSGEEDLLNSAYEKILEKR